ncbi:MAG: hypothetical protein IIC67_11450 [Thaumarchaeota archaeon]|nr:hypothetical protein [Nitrososphaerota archaeon]
MKHLKRNGMNIGSLKQHFRGKAHKTDPETGDLLHETNFLKIIKEARNQEDKKSRREEFDVNLHISKKISELKNTIYAMSVTKNELEGHWRTNMENLLIVRFGKEIGLVKDSDDYEFGI